MAMSESCYAYSPNNIIRCENGILGFLSYRALVPSCSEFLRMLLYISNPMFNFKELIQSANEVIFEALLRYEVACFRPSSIAIASLLIKCEHMGFMNFQQQIL
jgi:hypothetical protein